MRKSVYILICNKGSASGFEVFPNFEELVERYLFLNMAEGIDEKYLAAEEFTYHVSAVVRLDIDKKKIWKKAFEIHDNIISKLKNGELIRRSRSES